MNTAADVLASAAAGGSQGNPVIEAIATTRAGRAADLKSVNPLILVDTIRSLAILGEHEVVDRAYASWIDLPDGPVHFEAGLASLMARDLDEAAKRLERAVLAPIPQPMAWNSLALVRLARHDLDGAAAAIDRGLAAMPGDLIMSRTAAALYAIKGGSSTPDRQELIVLIERFMSHAQLARQAAALADTAAARALLQRRAGELDARPLAPRATPAGTLTAAPKVFHCTNVKVEPRLGGTFKVRLVLSRDEIDRALAGHTLSFLAQLPGDTHEAYLMRDDAVPVEPAPAVRLRVPPGLFAALRDNSPVTPLFVGVPFTLELHYGGHAADAAELADKEKHETSAYGGMIGGALMIGIGALRAATTSHPNSTNTLMMLIGAGMALYGVFRWLTLPRSGGSGPTRA